MQDETQNQNTQEVMEEAPVQTETSQSQDIGAVEAAPEPGAPSTEGQIDQVPPLDTHAADSGPIPEDALMDPFASEESPQVITDLYRVPDSEEPVDMDPAVTMTSEDLVGSDPKVTMNPEDIVNPETVEEAGIEENVVNWTDWNPNLDDDWGPYPGESGSSDTPDPAATTGIIVDPIDREFSFSDTDGNGIEDRWEEVSPTVSEEPTLGGYDGSGIAGGLDLDGNGVFDQIETNPDTSQPGYPGDDPAGQHEDNVIPDEGDTNPEMSDEEGYTYDEGAYEDAEDAFEDLQDALQDGDEEDLAEALEELQDYLGGFDKGDEDQENDSHNHGDQEDEQDENEIRDEAGIKPEISEDEDYAYDEDAYEDAEDALEDLQHALKNGDEEDRTKALEELQGYLNGFNKDNEEEEYTYDEGAYKDAEGALKDLQDALKNGDEEDRAEALEKLQGYLGGFDKGDEEDRDLTGGDPEGEEVVDPYGGLDTDDDGIPDYMDSDSPHQIGEWVTGINGEVWVPFNGEGDDSPENPEAPDASGAAVSGAAVGAGAVGEAGGLGETVEDIGEALGIDGAGDVIDTVVNGDFDQVLDGATEWAGDAIDDALGIEGSGEVLDDIISGDFDQALDTATEQAGDAIDDALGIEGSGEILEDVANGDFEEAFDGALETVVDAAGEVLEDVVDDIGDFFDDLW